MEDRLEDTGREKVGVTATHTPDVAAKVSAGTGMGSQQACAWGQRRAGSVDEGLRFAAVPGPVTLSRCVRGKGRCLIRGNSNDRINGDAVDRVRRRALKVMPAFTL